MKVPHKIYQLTHNYRSHSGILGVASSIIDLMVHFFPESFDRLDPDQVPTHAGVTLRACCENSDCGGNKFQRRVFTPDVTPAVLHQNCKIKFSGQRF